MVTIVGLFREHSGVEQALAELRKAGVAQHDLRVVTDEANLGVELGGSGHIFPAELARGGTLLVIDTADQRAHDVEVALRRAGVDDLVSRSDSPGADAPGTDEGAEAEAERVVTAESEQLTYGTDMGAGAAAGVAMGAPLGGGITGIGGGLLGATPSDHLDSDQPIDAPNPQRQSDIERERRKADPAP